MPGTGRIVYIAGAGISGLTLALALAKFGFNVVVLEKAATVSEFGAGLQISPNARVILDRLGIGPALDSASFEPAGIDLYPSGRKTPLITLELGAAIRQRFGSSYTVMHRADLADALYKACRRFANIDIVFDTQSWDVASNAGGVTVTSEESGGQTRTGRGQAFIGADGVHSHTRRQILEGTSAIFSGRVAWRTLLPFELVESLLALDNVSVMFGSNYHMVAYPLPHRRQVNLAFFAKTAGGGETLPLLSTQAQKDERVTALLAAGGSNWTAWPLYTVDAPSWHQGNIAITGDAAHAMVPFQAQGAAMGIEDAAVLATQLATASNAETAFRAFESIRRERVSRVARVSALNGRIFHLPWPLSVARDRIIALQGNNSHLRRLGWLYGYDAQLSAPARTDIAIPH